MLRKKLLLIFGSLIILLVATAIGAIWMLQGILSDLRHINDEAWTVIDEANDLGTTISLVEIELYELAVGHSRHLDSFLDAVEAMQRQLARVERSYVAELPESQAVVDGIHKGLPLFSQEVTALATAQDPRFAAQHRERALSAAIGLRQDILTLNKQVREHGLAEQDALTVRFRWLVLGLTIVFLLVINLSIVALLRMASVVLRPVEKLVEATRQLGQENFGYRVQLDQKDEFDELANSYNRLATQLQANEQRKLETLGQVALTLNHELNTAIAIIELQSELLNRQAGGNARIEKCARQIHESLGA